MWIVVQLVVAITCTLLYRFESLDFLTLNLRQATYLNRKILDNMPFKNAPRFSTCPSETENVHVI